MTICAKRFEFYFLIKSAECSNKIPNCIGLVFFLVIDNINMYIIQIAQIKILQLKT